MAGCAGGRTDENGDLALRRVKLPNGVELRCEVRITQEDMARGMMFRDALPEGRGMLFVHQTEGRFSYWMFQCRVPLDIIWMDASRRIVEIAANTPPCAGPAPTCPSYGGNAAARFVLELNGGQAARYGLRNGDLLEF